MLRVIGTPLTLGRDIDVSAVVSVTEHSRIGGQVWTRLYGRRQGFQKVIDSSKRFSGPTGRRNISVAVPASRCCRWATPRGIP